jgi:hypothetical protein
MRGQEATEDARNAKRGGSERNEKFWEYKTQDSDIMRQKKMKTPMLLQLKYTVNIKLLMSSGLG